MCGGGALPLPAERERLADRLSAHFIDAVRVLGLGAAGEELHGEALAVGRHRQPGRLEGHVAALVERGLDAEDADDRGDRPLRRSGPGAAVRLAVAAAVVDGQPHHVRADGDLLVGLPPDAVSARLQLQLGLPDRRPAAEGGSHRLEPDGRRPVEREADRRAVAALDAGADAREEPPVAAVAPADVPNREACQRRCAQPRQRDLGVDEERAGGDRSELEQAST